MNFIFYLRFCYVFYASTNVVAGDIMFLEFSCICAYMHESQTNIVSTIF